MRRHRFPASLVLLLLLAACAGRKPEPDRGDAGAAAPGALAKTSLHCAPGLGAGARGATAEASPETIEGENGVTYVALHLEFSDEASCAALAVDGIHVFSRFRKWADVCVPVDDVMTLLGKAEGLVWCDPGGATFVPPPPAGEPAPSRGEAEETVRGGSHGLTGKGVIVAVVDSGLDFRHPDFITYDDAGQPTSRVLYLWDTTSDAFEAQGLGRKAPVTYPGGASVGTVYARDQLTADLRAAEPRIGVTDANGHGTACAGIAAGNGNAEKRYCGVAPDADIIAVRIGGTPETSLENAFLIGAICGWVDAVAVGRPYVVSCSFGGHYASGHDGSMVIERQLDARFPSGAKGRALCIAAGNEARNGLHGETTFSSQESKGALSWESESAVEMRVYFGSTAAEDLLWDLEAPEGKGKDVLIDMRRHALTGQVFWIVTAPAGAFTLRPYSVSGTEVSADAYILGAPGTRFTGACAAPSRQVGSPGTASQAITVGSYDFNSEIATGDGTATIGAGGAEMTIGAISYYSNPGPRRMDAATKPEVTAPGQYHAACFPLGQCGLDQFVHRDPSGKYAVTFNGTSAATPYCAGVIALALQKNPDLTFGQIRELLAKSARSDAFTGETPNATWGFGKLDLAAVEALLESVPAK